MKGPHIIATVSLFKSGGRDGPTPADSLRCILVIGNQNYDVAIWLDKIGRMLPGDTARVPVSFVSPELVAEHLTTGMHFKLRDFRLIGEGTIEEVLK